MRKRLMGQGTRETSGVDDLAWLDLERLAIVELTSEDADHPIEAALQMTADAGWFAQQPGKQTIRLLFDKPQNIRHIQLLFEDMERARTQEFVLRWSAASESSYREIVRQQYNFSPPDVTRELEDYRVDLAGLALLELTIIPDISGGDARASLARLRLA